MHPSSQISYTKASTTFDFKKILRYLKEKRVGELKSYLIGFI